MQVAKWGNSSAVRLPASVVEARKPEGDDIEIVVDSSPRFRRESQAHTEELLQRLRRFRGQVARRFQVQPG